MSNIKRQKEIKCRLNRERKNCVWEQESRFAQSELRVQVGIQYHKRYDNISLHSHSTILFTKECFINYFIRDSKYIH